MLQIYEPGRTSVDHQKSLFPPGENGLLTIRDRETPSKQYLRKNKLILLSNRSETKLQSTIPQNH